MKKNIKAKLKLATICPIMALILAGCKYRNIVEDVCSDKILVKDIKDGTQRILMFNDKTQKQLCDFVTYAHYGDTIVLIQSASNFFGRYKTHRCLKICDINVKFDESSSMFPRQQQLQFDSLKSAMLREKQR